MDDAPTVNAVEIRNVYKEYASGDTTLHVLKGINLDVKSGEILLITGPSGSGKTTLLSAIAGVLPFDKGEIEIFGHPIRHMSNAEMTEFRKVNVGFIFQQFHLIKTLDVLQNVSIPLILNNFNKTEIVERASEILNRVGLKGKEKVRTSHLSIGEQQRVAIARALIHNPMLVICDEPTAALDAENGEKIMELLTEIAKASSRSVIIVTHDNRIFKYGDEICRLENGQIAWNQNDIR